MRSLPLIRLAVVIALFLLALIPLWNLTAAKETAAPASPIATKNDQSVPTQIALTSSVDAVQIKILYLGKVVWEGTGGTPTLDLPQTAYDLQIQATWTPNETRENALRVHVSRDDLPLADSTFWGRNQIDDVLNVPAN